MDCRDLLLMISDFLDGEVNPSLCRELEKHMAECNPCRIVVDTTSRTISFYKGLSPGTIPPSARVKLRKRLGKAVRPLGR